MPLYLEILGFMFNDKRSSWLKIFLVTHFLLTVIGAAGASTPAVYLFYNSPTLILMFWSVGYKNNLEFLRLIMLSELFTMIADIFYTVMQLYIKGHSLVYFSSAVTILQLVLRPYVVRYLLLIKDEAIERISSEDLENAEFSKSSMGVNEYEAELYDEKNPFETGRLARHSLN
ncbi:unnamed protein product [Phyllotreta striolata]|uniref:Uncharacterized protein n=1 Tax=Phyllotreta striolata TaxID=444603 RepID=A0A9N9TCT8_PHYSR|nr:unnamed protein product [Phyllotreta striolata]